MDQWGGVETKKQRDKQQAWVEEEDFPFLTDDDVLPDDRHEVGELPSCSLILHRFHGSFCIVRAQRVPPQGYNLGMPAH